MISLPRPDVHAHVSGETSAARMWLLCSVAVILGLVGGGAAVGLFKFIGFISHLVLLHNIGVSLPTLRHYHPSPIIILTAVGGALLVGGLAMWSPVIRGHGIPESLETILSHESRISPRAALAKPLSAAITIGTGGPFGAEGPIIVTAGSFGSLIGQTLSISPVERRIMLATGAAAGMAGTFNAPLASVILALELVMFERSLRTVIPPTIACAIAAGIHTLVFGSAPLFAVHHAVHVAFGQLPLFAVVGIAAGCLAVVLSKGLFAAEALFRRLPISIFWWPAIGAIGFTLIGLLEPRSLSMGYSAISDTINGRFVVGTLAALFAAKLFSWWIALSSQTSGGTLAPMFLIGATMGCLVGHGFEYLIPGAHIAPIACALVAMCATFGAAAKAPFTAIVFVFEVTGQYHMVIPLMIGMAAAELVAQVFLGSDRLMTEKLSHRGYRVDFKAAVGPLRMKVLSQLMQEPVVVRRDATADQALAALGEKGATVVAVVDDADRYLGLTPLADLTARAAHDGVPPVGAFERLDEATPDGDALTGRETVAELGILRLKTVKPQDFLVAGLAWMIEHGLQEVPIVLGESVVGRVTRADIDAERLRHYRDHETPQPGWGAALIGRRRPGSRALPDGAVSGLRSPGGLSTDGATEADQVMTGAGEHDDLE